MASDVTTTSLNSQGSAMKEQLAYMDSYEARVNRMKTSITQLAVSIGDSFLEDALYVGIDLIDKMSLSLADLIDQFGALPMIFGAGGILTSAMTKSGGPLGLLKMMASQVGGVFTKMQEGALSVGTRISSWLSGMVVEFAQSGNAIKQVIGGVGQGIQKVMGSLGVAGSGLLATAGITAAFIAVGYAIDKLLERQRALNEAQRKYEDTMERSREAVRSHGNDLTGLVGRYEELEKVINSGNYSDEQLAEYNKTVNDLSEAIPGAVSHIDSLGEVHLKNTDVIYDEARAVEELAREYANIDAGELGEGITEQIENIKVLSEQTNTLKDRVEGLKMTISEGGYWESYGEGSEKVKETTEKIDEQTNAVRVLEAQMAVAMKEITDGIQSQVLLLVEANEETYNLTGAAESMSNAFVDAQKQMMNINMDDFYDKWGRFDSDGFAKAITDAQNEITAKSVEFTKNLNEMYGRIGEGFKGEKLNEIRNAMDSVLDKARESGIAIDEGLIISLENLNNSIANGGSTVDDYVQHLVDLGFESDDAKNMVIDMGDAHGNAAIKFQETQGALASLSDELSDYREELEAINTIDVVYGIESETTKAIESHLSTLELLKAEYSEGWYDTTAGQQSVKQMADELNVSEAYIKQHLGTVSELFKALSSVEIVDGEDGSPVKKYADTISKDTIDMLDEIQHLVQHSGLTFEQALVSVLDTTIVITEEKIQKVRDILNNASIDTPEGEANLVRDLAKELDELEGSFSAVSDEAGNLQFIMNDGSEHEMLTGISGLLQEIGFDLSLAIDDTTGLRQVMIELPSGRELPIATIPDTVYEGTESIGLLKQAFVDFKDLTNVEQQSAFIKSLNGQMDMFRDELRVVHDEVDGFQLVLSDGTTSPWLDVLNQQLEAVGAKIIDANAETEEFELGIQWADGSETIFDGAGSSAIDYLSDVERANAHTEVMQESLERVKQLTDEVLAEHNAAMIEIDENNDIKYTADLDQESLNAVVQGLDVNQQLSELNVLDEEGNIQVIFATHAVGTEVTAQQISEVTGQAQQLATYTDEFGNIVQYFIPEVKNEEEARKALASLLSDDNIGEVVSDGSGGWKVTYNASVDETSLNETENKLDKVGKSEDGSERSVVFQAESTGTDTVTAEFDAIIQGAEKVEGMSINVKVTEGTITSLGDLRSLLGLVDEDIKTTVDLAMDMILKLEAAGDAAQTIMKQAPSLRGITAEAEALMTQLEETAKALQDIFDLAQQDLSIDISTTFSGFEELVAQMENVQATLHELSKVTTAQANSQVNTYKNMSSEVKKILADMGARISKVFSDIAKDSKDKTDKMGKDVVKSLGATRNRAINVMTSMGRGMLNEITKKYKEIVQESSSLPGLIGKGIRDNMSQASNSMQTLADNMVSRFKKALGIQSPSRVFMSLGGHVIDGLVKGLSDDNIKGLGQDVFNDFSQGAFSTIDEIKSYMTFDPVGPANFGGSFTKTSNFGSRWGRLHAGVDYAAPMGTPIRAQSGGRVVVSGYHSGYGNYVAVQNGPVRQIYAHNSRNMAQVGQTVKAGQIVGLVGSTGNSTGPHVHYEVRVNGRPVNPMSYFRGFADGGFVDEEELAWHGEDGPEVIIPLSAQRRERGLDLWAEAGERMGLSRELIDLYKRSGTAAQASVSAFSAMDGEMAASSDGEAGAGTFVPSTNDIMRVVNPEYSAMEKEELPELYRYMSYGSMMELQDIKELEKARTVLGTLTEGAIEYRNAMKEVWSQTKDVIRNERKELEKLNDRQRELSFRIVELKREGAETNKASKKMREEYNAAQQEYEENYSRIYELESSRVQNIASNNQTIIDMHKDMVNELIDIYDRLEQVRSDAIADYQYQLDHLSIAQPEKIGRQMTLNYQILSETNALMQVQANRVSQLTKEMDKFNKAYGPDDERTRHTQEALRQATSEYRSTVLTVANLEKSLEDTRREVAENSVEDVKRYHSQVHSMTVRALELERQEYEKSHEKRMKMYDDEISRIESIYDAKIKALDADKEEADYQEELESLSNERADVMSSISRLSRDNSLEAKKQMKELQDELLRIDGDIKSTQEARQDKLYRDAIEEQKQAQIDEFERGRELDEKAHESRMDALEEQKNASDRYYEDMLGDERKWDNIIDAYVRGDDNKLSAAIGEMNRGLNKLSAGDFFNLTVGYDGLSRNSKAQITEETLMDIKNLVYNSSKNTERMADIYNNRGDHYIRHIPIDTVAPPRSDSWSGQTTKSDAVADKAGIYAEVQRREKEIQKVAPKVNDSSSSSSTVKQRSHKISRGDTLWDLAQKYYGDPYKWRTIASANSSINPSTLPVGKNIIIPFRDGGMTPDWPGNEGKIAMLHKKELVLTAEQTEDILGAARYMGEVVTKYPTFDSGKVSVPELSASNNTNTTIGDINLYFDNYKGTKEESKNVAQEIIKNLKKF